MTKEQLLLENKQLKEREQLYLKYLKYALSDMDICCNEQNGFLKISEPIKHEFSYEHILSIDTLPEKIRQTFVGLGLSSMKINTHNYSFGTYEWRFKDEVEKLIERFD